MKAIICPRFGPPNVLKMTEILPPIPKPDEVLIRNYGTSINTVDILARSGKPPKITVRLLKPLIASALRILFTGLFKPRQKILGCGFAGEIVSVGSKVIEWKKGDHVYGYNPKAGACAEFLVVSASLLAKKPTNLTFTEASAIPGGLSPVLTAFRECVPPKKDQKILIIGASGGIGTFAVQIAKLHGAYVTGVCGPSNIELLQRIGADEVIDYTKEDYVNGTNVYDIIYDVVGVTNISQVSKILDKNGIFLANNPTNSFKNMFYRNKDLPNRPKLKSYTADESAEFLESMRTSFEEGKIKPVIDTVFPLAETAKAHELYETGHSKGRVVIYID